MRFEIEDAAEGAPRSRRDPESNQEESAGSSRRLPTGPGAWTSREPRRQPIDDLLTDPYCRHLLEALRRADGSMRVSDLATEVAARVDHIPPEEVEATVRRRVQTWLHHGQLPALVERGVVTYDPETGFVGLAADD